MSKTRAWNKHGFYQNFNFNQISKVFDEEILFLFINKASRNIRRKGACRTNFDVFNICCGYFFDTSVYVLFLNIILFDCVLACVHFNDVYAVTKLSAATQ